MQNLNSITATTVPRSPFIDEEADISPKQFLWTSDEYYRAAELGFFNGRRVELIEGEIIEMAPMGSLHATGITLLAELLRGVFESGHFVRTQGPLDVDENSQPEPDIAVVQGSPRDYSSGHPKTLLLAAEVSVSSLTLDRGVKARLYAKAGVQEYWIVNLRDRCVEVYRNPIEDPNLGFVYAERNIAGEDQFVSPLAKPKAKIKVADILP